MHCVTVDDTLSGAQRSTAPPSTILEPMVLVRADAHNHEQRAQDDCYLYKGICAAWETIDNASLRANKYKAGRFFFSGSLSTCRQPIYPIIELVKGSEEVSRARSVHCNR